jgi:hypothetical protein
MLHAVVIGTTQAWSRCPDRTGPDRRAKGGIVLQARPMTTPEPEGPQPRDIALELETPELAADLEAQSDPQGGPPSDESSSRVRGTGGP